MAGHSKFANIKHRKGAQDKKRASLFTKLGREIIVAAKLGGPDVGFNPRLRAAVAAAKAQSMPKDRIEYAIKRATSAADGDNYEEMRYEGYAPNGIALIIEALTDNRNRTASEVRSILGKSGGNLGESGAVSFMFNRVGLLQYPVDKASADEMFEAALEAGADNCESDDENHEITCEVESFNEVRDAMSAKYDDADVSKLGWVPTNTIEVDFETAEKIIRLIENLEDDDDVQNVYSNFSVSDEVAEKLAAE